MNVSETQLKEVNALTLLLHMMYDLGVEPVPKHWLRAKALQERNISSHRFTDAFDELIKNGFMHFDPNLPERKRKYRLSASGAKYIESIFELNLVDQTEGDRKKILYDYRTKKLETKPESEIKSHIADSSYRLNAEFWTKWGSVSAIAALPLTFILWYLSQ